jgi:hypothetical protein
MRNRRGLSIEEYAVLIAAAVGVSIVMTSYFRDSLRGLVRQVEIMCNTMAGS